VADDETVRALEHEMGVLVRRLRRLIAERARQVHPDLAPVGYSMLVALQDEPRRASELVDLFSIDKGAVSRQVQSLLELGLIERTPDPEDRRAAILAITPLGHERMEAVAEDRRTEVRERLGDWTDDDLAQLVGSMARYNQALDLP
jgi:DNA-binding MarR family transcriptional regulator